MLGKRIFQIVCDQFNLNYPFLQSIINLLSEQRQLEDKKTDVAVIAQRAKFSDMSCNTQADDNPLRPKV